MNGLYSAPFTGSTVAAGGTVTVTTGIQSDIELLRFGYLPHATVGRMVLPDQSRVYTIERPWLQNQHDVSCIPCGRFPCRPRRFNAGGYAAVEIVVPGRDLTLFHIANRAREVKGCVGVTSALGVLRQEPFEYCGLQSLVAFKRFMKFYGKEKFFVNIRLFNPETDRFFDDEVSKYG